MGIFKKFKKAVKTGIKGAGKVAKKHPAFRLGSAVSKVVRKKSRTRKSAVKFFVGIRPLREGRATNDL